ncbi:MAG TPA: GGDEF domain-containing protein [Steroidobacteraceae bacterium]|jgi:diguanylate cyclase|nr:GGDEF domain-containing protein [Steroidobacteraceae bacterium]
MRYQHSREESAEILRRALQLMSPHEAGYHPVSYAVWYEHAGDLNPALTREIDKLLAVDSVLSDTEICRLHAMHIAGRDVQAFELAQRQLREVLGESEKQAAHAERTVKRFTADLDDAVQDVRRDAQGGTLASMEKMVRVLAEASRLQGVLGVLHQQLTLQRQQVDDVMERLERAQIEPLRDPLTGLKNLHGLRRTVEAGASSELTGVAFLAVDVDYFKRVNDTHGHVVGDKVLAKVAEILREHLTGEAMAARLGGDEFALLVPVECLEDAAALAEQIRATATRTVITRTDGMQYIGAVTLSIGVAIGEPSDTLESLRHRADEALYDAKDAGRNRVALAPTNAADSSAAR